MSLASFPGRTSVIIPAFNEEGILGRTIEATAAALAGCDYEIVAVDDGSTDRTWLEAQGATGENERVRAVHCDCRGGKGQALQAGFAVCRGDLVAFLDADLDLHPRQLHTLYQVMVDTGADVVIGSKRHPQSRLDYPGHRKAVSIGYFWLVRALFGLAIRDTQTGIKLFRRRVLADAFPRIRTAGYAFDLDLLVAATRFGYRIAEAPVEITSQRQKLGRIGLRTILAMLWDTLRIFYRASFWKWLNPGSAVKFWLLAFVAGLVAASFGAASVLTFLPLPGWVSTAGHYLLLQFLPRGWRNLVLIAAGSAVVLMALIQLNKSVMRAFARPDEGDLAGIVNKPARSAAGSRPGVGSEEHNLEQAE